MRKRCIECDPFIPALRKSFVEIERYDHYIIAIGIRPAKQVVHLQGIGSFAVRCWFVMPAIRNEYQWWLSFLHTVATAAGDSCERGETHTALLVQCREKKDEHKGHEACTSDSAAPIVLHHQIGELHASPCTQASMIQGLCSLWMVDGEFVLVHCANHNSR